MEKVNAADSSSQKHVCNRVPSLQTASTVAALEGLKYIVSPYIPIALQDLDSST